MREQNAASLPADLRLLRRLFQVVPRGHRVVRAAWRRRLRRLGPVRLSTKFGFDLLLDPADNIGWAIVMHGNWEPAITSLVRSQLKDGDVFVDVGANYGWHALSAAAVLAPAGGRVVAYEPQEKLCRLLRRSAALSNLGNVSVVQAAVSDRTSWGSLQLPRADRPELATLRDSGKASDGTRIVSLDEEFPGPSAPAVVMIDAEGFELRVLRGMERLLKSSPPRSLVIEVHPPLMARVGDDAGGLLDALRSRGYHVSLIRADGKLSPVSEPGALVRAARASGCCNILAARAEA